MRREKKKGKGQQQKKKSPNDLGLSKNERDDYGESIVVNLNRHPRNPIGPVNSQKASTRKRLSNFSMELISPQIYPKPRFVICTSLSYSSSDQGNTTCQPTRQESHIGLAFLLEGGL